MNAPPANPPLPIRVFLVSPGDVGDERALALRVLERLPYDPFLRGRIALEAVAWDKPGADTPMLATLTPQEAIAQQRPKPSACDIVVVIFWSRMGTPLPPEYRKPDGSPYRSGTEWEYLDALDASQRTGRPKVLVYRRTEEPRIGLNDPRFREKQDQWRLVEDFFSSFRNPDGSIRHALNEYDTPDAFEKKLTEHLREILQGLLTEHETRSQPPTAESASEAPPLWTGSPFPGLRAFGAADAPIYFGRGRETDGLIRRLGEGARFIAVVGASGSGKSSLVAAGLLPRLRENAIPGSRDWLCVSFTPGKLSENPFIALVSRFESALERHGRRIGDETKRLESEPEALGELTGLMLENFPEWSELLLFVDQFEELFTVVAEKYRGAFSALLAHAATLPRLRTVVTLRADFYHRCLEQPALEEPLRAGSYPLAAPGVGALHEMIVRPAARAGLTFEDELPERILDDTGAEPGALPLMAFALEQLYGKRSAEGGLTHAAYEAFGGVKGAISRRAEETYGGLRPAAQATLAAVFRELVEVDLTDEGWVATRRRAEFGRVAATPEARELVSAFQRARLLQQSQGEGDRPVVEVAHEALLRNWPRLTDWIQKTGENLAVLCQLRHAAGEWQEQDRRGDLRWPRRRWKQADGAIARLGMPVNDPLPAFLAASRRHTRRQMMLLGIGVGALALAVWLESFTYTTAEGNLKYAVAVLWEGMRYRLGISSIKEPEMVQLLLGEDPRFPPSFQMGCISGRGCGKDELPIRTVTFDKSFAIGRYEVTFEEYEDYMQLMETRDPHDFTWGRERRPVIDVSWEDASAYARWLSLVTGKAYRLPTEAEWEYAARAGTRTRWSFGDDESELGRYAWYSENSDKKTHPVGEKGPNPWGLHDVHGNVWEWVQDCWHNSYEGAPSDGSAWGERGDGDCGRRVVRGGSWSYGPGFLRSADRSGGITGRAGDLGFRLAQDP